MAKCGIRYDFSLKEEIERTLISPPPKCSLQEFEEWCTFLRKDSYGEDALIQTPFGQRRLIYADFAASGRSLKCIETNLQTFVLPMYGNTHSAASFTARQTTNLRNEARQIIKHYFNATEEDALIFCGDGVTAAVHKFINIMHASEWTLPSNIATTKSLKNRLQGKGKLKDPYFREDRWGACECTLCHIRFKHEHLYRAHHSSEKHLENIKTQEEKFFTPSHSEEAKTSPNSSLQREVVFLCDPLAHHSVFLPFKELSESSSSASSPINLIFTFSLLDLDVSTATLNVDALEAKLQHYSSSSFEVSQSREKRKEEEKINRETMKISFEEKKITEEERTSTGEKLPSKEDNYQQKTSEVILIVLLTAVSNVTGVQQNIQKLSNLVHRYGGILCWDLAAAVGHIPIDLNPVDSPLSQIDVAFVSSHKLLGGPGTPGILLAKKKFLCNATPSSPGGGVVFFVSQTSHSYIQNTEEREESGTPNILGSIRCGLVYRLLSMISMENIQQKECWMAQYLKERWKQHPRIHLLGPHTARSTPTLSLLLLYGNSPLSGAQDGLYLHHFFVVALLNDLFGIQTRGGCACAGPYIQHLLTLEEPILSTFETCLWSTGQEVLRPGVVRISLHFTLSIEDIHRIGEAIDWIASYGWMLLPAYTFIPETGEWLHRSEQSGSRFRLWLSDFPLFNGGNPANPSFLASEGESSPSFSFQSRVPPLSRMTSPPPPLSIPTSPPPPPLSIPTSPSPPSSIPTSISALLAAATRCVRQTCAEAAPSGVGTSSLPSSYHSLLWFALPEDARETLRLSPPTLMFPDSRGAICNGRKKERGAFSPLSEGKTEATITFEGTPHLCQCLGKESSLLPVCSYKNNSPQEIRVETACFHVRLYAPLTRENSSSCLSSSSLREEEEDRKVENDGSGRETSRKLSSSSLASATPASTPFVSFSQLSVGMEIQPVENKAKLLFLTIPQNLRRTVGAAIREFKMLQEGDRILLGLSGGKDSLTLLHILRDLQKRAPISFELSVCTVDPQTPEYNPRPLIPYLKALGIPYHFLSHPLISIAKKHMKNDSLCSFCSRIKRGILYNCMRENGYNVLVLGQHLDDICESFIMSAFQNGILNTMKANYTIKEGDLRVCRPLIFTRERALQKFARTNNLPVIQENCPACFASPKERLKAKILLSAQEFENPYLFQNLLKSLRPLMALPHAQNFEQHLSHILATSSEISDTVQVDSPQ